MNRNISARDYKLLYAKSAGRCNICKVEVFNHNMLSNEYIHIGQMAHNESFSDKAEVRPRPIDQSVPDNSYKNLILLCANHHLEVDQDPNYTVEKIKIIKNDFENFVSVSLEKVENTDLKILNLISEYSDFQYLMKALEDPLYSLPSNIGDIGDVNNFILQAYTPSLYPFLDEKLNNLMESILDKYYQIRPYVFTYYFSFNGLIIRPNKEHSNFLKDSDDIERISFELSQALYNWLVYCRKNNY